MGVGDPAPIRYQESQVAGCKVPLRPLQHVKLLQERLDECAIVVLGHFYVAVPGEVDGSRDAGCGFPGRLAVDVEVGRDGGEVGYCNAGLDMLGI